MNQDYTVIERMWIDEAKRHTQVEDEEWVVDQQFPGYIISSYGQVYSFRSHRLLRPSWTSDGAYRQVSIIDASGKNRSLGVHRLMAIVFLGPPNEGDEANHIDGIPDNNHISNIEWLSKVGNGRHTREVLRRPERWRAQVQQMRDC